MIKEVIKYEDFNGEEQVTEEWFNLTKAELSQMQFEAGGTLDKQLQNVIDSKDIKEIAAFFKKIIMKSYGKRSADNQSFRKKDTDGHLFADDFEATAAFDAFYMSLLEDTKKAAKFVTGILPKDIQGAAEKAQKSLEEKNQNNDF